MVVEMPSVREATSDNFCHVHFRPTVPVFPASGRIHVSPIQVPVQVNLHFMGEESHTIPISPLS